MDSRAWKGQLRLAGPFQQLVMLAVIRLGRDTNATFIQRHIEHVTGRRFSLTAVHTTLGRLARRGPLGTPRNIRRCFRVTALGRRAVRLTLLALDSMLPGLPGFSREHELFSWDSLFSPDPTVEWTLRRFGWQLEPLKPDVVSC